MTCTVSESRLVDDLVFACGDLKIIRSMYSTLVKDMVQICCLIISSILLGNTVQFGRTSKFVVRPEDSEPENCWWKFRLGFRSLATM